MAVSNSTAIDRAGMLVSSAALSALRYAPGLSPAQWIQVFYVVSTGLVLGVAVLPKRARAYLLTYGARAPKASEEAPDSATGQDRTDEPYRDEAEDVDGAAADGEDVRGSRDAQDGEHGREGGATEATEGRPERQDRRGEDGQGSQDAQDDWFAKFVNVVTSWGQIPHSWFGGFYAFSLACSVFWLVQYLTDGRVLHFLATRQAAASAPGMEPGQVSLLWTMMFLQGTRRFIESSWLVKPGKKSTMWIVHWVLGNAYYLMMSTTVWIEGSGKMARVSTAFPVHLLTNFV